MKLNNLQPGDYIKFLYGFDILEFYVLQNYPNISTIKLTRRSWLSTASIFFTYNKLEKQSDWIYLGQGKKCKWRKFLPWIKELIPIYSKPKSQYNMGK